MIINEKNAKEIIYDLNVLDVLLILWVNAAAFFFEFGLHELPCPLCLLQRFGLLLTMVGFLMNIRFGTHPAHYGFSLLSALFTAAVAIRQILLHIIPGTETYGSALFGLHTYTWSFITSVAIVIVTICYLFFEKQFTRHFSFRTHPHFGKVLFVVAIGMCVLNIVSVFMVCGFGSCPDNPTAYLYKI